MAFETSDKKIIGRMAVVHGVDRSAPCFMC
jgi:hypothetical protein